MKKYAVHTFPKFRATYQVSANNEKEAIKKAHEIMQHQFKDLDSLNMGYDSHENRCIVDRLSSLGEVKSGSYYTCVFNCSFNEWEKQQ